MEYSKRYHPISYLKTNSEALAKELAEEVDAVVITQDGVPSFVCLSFDEFHRILETNALVKLVNMGKREIERCNFRSLAEARKDLDQRILGVRNSEYDKK